MSRLPLVVLWMASLLVLMPASPAHAQTPSPQTPRTALEALPSAAQARVVPADTTLRFRTRAVAGGRLDVDAGILRAAYRLDAPPRPGALPEAAARAYLADAASAFGLPAVASDLELASVTTTGAVRHVRFRQTFRGLPVHNRHVLVNLGTDGRATMVLSGYAPHLADVADFDARPALSASAATDRVRADVLDGAGETGPPTLVVVPSATPRLAWQMIAWPEGVPAEWNVLLDAHTGELIHLFDQALRLGHNAPPPRRVDGSGLVFDPDPLSTAGQPYGPPFVDANDTAIPDLDDERILVTLPEITQGSDALYRLEGPFVRIVGEDNGGNVVYTPPAEADPNGFRYTRDEEGFEAVMAYFHADQSQRYVQSLGITGRQQGPLPINPQGLTNDDSFFFPSRNLIIFGTGGVDDAEDASVIWHEYAHALLEAAAPGLLSTVEGSALHEGWADYWAGSYLRHLVDTGTSQRTDWRRLFKWDSGDGQIWPGRVMDRTDQYPGDLCVTRANPVGCSVHDDGRLWATTMMTIYDDLGRDLTDHLSLLSHSYLAAPVTFRDAAEAIIQADIDQYGGVHVDLLIERFAAHGLVDPAGFGPVLAHDPLPSTEATSGSVRVEVDAMGLSAGVDSVYVVYGYDAAPTNRVPLALLGSERWVGEMPLPAQAATVRYYFEAVDTNRLRAVLPGSAPAETFRFFAGPDAEPPTLAHTPIVRASLATWPTQVVATVEDNLGVDSVWVVFSITHPDGTAEPEDGFALSRDTDDLYRGVFPVPIGKIQRNSRVEYRLFARDRAASPNEAAAPESGTYDFVVVAEGILREFTFEQLDADLKATGAWARGAPTYGLGIAHSGSQVWATPPDAAYPNRPGRATLELPPLNLADLGPTFLTFWHWHDLEHDGTAAPGVPRGAVLWDGVNVKHSTDGGATWRVLTPEGGYSGTLIPTSNPMATEPAFGGYSFGWRQVLIPLPEADDVRLRFDLGTDESNTDATAHGYAGYFLDDVVITTERPVDTERPTVIATPAPVIIRAVGTALPLLTVRAADDQGVADVFADYTILTSGGSEDGTLRLAMETDDLFSFSGRIVPSVALSAGDRVEYRLRIVDGAGNVTRSPVAGNAPFAVEYRLIENAGVFADVSASGAWQGTGTLWTATASGPEADRSSLVLEPLDLPANPVELTFLLDHRYDFDDGTGGNVKITTDDGATWQVLAPEDGYTGTFSPGTAHPMDGEPILLGGVTSFIETAFDLVPYAGQQVRLRVDLGAARALSATEFWQIRDARLRRATTDDGFEVPRALKLLANFPDPFATTTTISYTLPEALPVEMAVFDMLGRQLAVLVDGNREAGTHTLRFDGSRLAAGVYLLRFRAGGTQRIERMVVAR